MPKISNGPDGPVLGRYDPANLPSQDADWFGKPKVLHQETNRKSAQNATAEVAQLTSELEDHSESMWRHREWQGRRVLVREAMERVNLPSARLERFDECGARCCIERSPSTQRVRLRGSYCHDRNCQPCGKARANRIAKNLQTHIAGERRAEAFRLVTLTLKHTTQPLAKQLDLLVKYFRVLRKAELWSRTQDGGCFAIEVKKNDRGEWHPHLHVIVQGVYLRQDRLSDLWCTITDGSFRVDVRMIRDVDQACYYVAKYCSKPIDDSLYMDADTLDESIRAFGGRRLCSTFGTWRGLKLEAKGLDPKDWIFCWRLCEFLRLLRAGDETAKRFARDNQFHLHLMEETGDLYADSS